MNFHLNLYSSPMPHGSAPLSEDHAHLSDNQIDDQLVGDLAAGPTAHLAACPICAGRVAAAASPLASFQSVTMAWSERRAATLPIPDFTRQQPFWQRHMAWVTACLIFAIGIALTNASHQAVIRTAELQPMQQAAPPSAVLTETASATVAPREAQIFADNQLLKTIDDDLSASADTPAALGIEPVSAQPSRSPTTRSVQD